MCSTDPTIFDKMQQRKAELLKRKRSLKSFVRKGNESNSTACIHESAARLNKGQSQNLRGDSGETTGWNIEPLKTNTNDSKHDSVHIIIEANCY